jgi:hypothetical protein
MLWLVISAIDTIGDYKVVMPTSPAPTKADTAEIVYGKDVKVVKEQPFDIDAALAKIMLGVEFFVIVVAFLILLVLLLRWITSHESWIARNAPKQRYFLSLAKQKELRHRKKE